MPWRGYPNHWLYDARGWPMTHAMQSMQSMRRYPAITGKLYRFTWRVVAPFGNVLHSGCSNHASYQSLAVALAKQGLLGDGLLSILHSELIADKPEAQLDDETLAGLFD